MAETQEFIATGRRKTAVARIRMMPGNGKIDVNGKSFEDYFPTVPLQNTVLQPLQVVKLANAYDISVNTSGGGADRSGWSCAARDFAGAVASGREPSRHVESRRFAHARSADEGTEEVRATGRAQTVPVLEAIIPLPFACRRLALRGARNISSGSLGKTMASCRASQSEASTITAIATASRKARQSAPQFLPAAGPLGCGAWEGAAAGTGGAAGFGKDVNSRIASFITRLSRYWLSNVSQIRRASSKRFFRFQERHLGEERERSIEALRIFGREPLIGAERLVIFA